MKDGYRYICGLDGVGLGALYGNIVVASALLELPTIVKGARDSKDMSEKQRTALLDTIYKQSKVVDTTSLTVEDYNKIGPRKCEIAGATRLMSRLTGLDFFDNIKFVIDGNYKVSEFMPGLADTKVRAAQIEVITKGDSLVNAISVASIVAKHTRDTSLIEDSLKYPGYGLEGHKGYYSAAHVEALAKLGYTVQHRKCSYKFSKGPA